MRSLAAIPLALWALVLGACAASPGPRSAPDIETGAFHPPPSIFINLNDARTTAHLKLEFPHPGWNHIIDDHRTSPEAREIYITIYRPDPRSFYPMVTKNISATVPLDGAPKAVVYARTIDHDLRDTDRPYRLAAEAR